jgi:3'-5' exoribonuclease
VVPLACINRLDANPFLCSYVLSDPLFFISPGSAEHHHNYRYGLLQHTQEVMANVSAMCYGNPSTELVTAVIWHDYMKIRDYSINADGKITKEAYGKLINHVSGSAIAFEKFAVECKVPPEFRERVLHLILSHHGRKEWGSPIEPATAEAFILHAADMMSSRGCNILESSIKSRTE